MRSIAAALLGIGGIFVAFGLTVFIITWLAKVNSHPGLAEMVRAGAVSMIGGAILMALGFLAGRMGRRPDGRRSIA